MTNLELYSTRCEHHEQDYKRLNQRHRLTGNARLLGVIVGFGLLWLVEAQWPSLRWPLVAALGTVFVWSTRILAGIEHRAEYARRALSFYWWYLKADLLEDKSSRSDGKSAADKFLQTHPFASDLDLMEADGLITRVSRCATAEGIERLIDLLTQSASIDVIAERQEVVRELAPNVALRERIHVEGSRRGRLIRTKPMLRWAASDGSDTPSWVVPVGLGVSLSSLASVTVLALAPSAAVLTWALASLATALVVGRVVSRSLKVPTLEAENLHVDFSQLQALVQVLETQTFESAFLRHLTESLQAGDRSASKALAGIRRIITLYEARRNQFVALLGPIVLYEVHLSLLVERWRARHATRISAWIQAVAQFEAFASMAGFAFVNQRYVYPELREQGPVLRAQQLGHPLLGESAVGNDLVLDSDCPVLLVSGANMAGKSTLLRTIGVNLALAFAGAPVRAESMTISNLKLFTSIRGTDSLQQGDSRFSTELRRIRNMLDSVQQGHPTLILIDELFGGTNSYDRFTGAAALCEHLLACEGLLAVLSTHDRNVTRWAGEHSQRIRNVHFRDVVDDEAMTFDYKLHEGPATQGNAVKLMRLAGIPVPEHQETVPS